MSTRKFIIADPDKCTGCGVCELICSASKFNGFNPSLSTIRMVRIEPLIDIALACRLCDDPACVRCCPRKCLTQNEDTGVIVVDESKCDGCGWCITACKYGAITIDPDKKVAIVCDLCDGDPPCVKFCLEQALECTTLKTVSKKAQRSAAKKLLL